MHSPNGSTSSHSSTTIGHDTEVSWQTNQTPARPANVAIARLDGLTSGFGVFAVDGAEWATSKRKTKSPGKKSSVKRKAGGRIFAADVQPIKARLNRRLKYNTKTQQRELWGGGFCPFDKINGGKCGGTLNDTHVASCHVVTEAKLWMRNDFDEAKISTWDRKWILHNKDLAEAAAGFIRFCGVGDCEEVFTRSDSVRRHRFLVHGVEDKKKGGEEGEDVEKSAYTTMRLLKWIGGLE